MSLRKSLKKEERAEVTGLPLMLLILVVVAGVGLAIILGMMGKIGKGPDGVGSVAYSEFATGKGIQRLEIPGTLGKLNQEAAAQIPLNVTVYSTSNSPVENATVTVTGPVRAPALGTTSSSGVSSFTQTTWVLPPQKATGEVHVKVEYSGWPSYETTFLLVRS